MTQTATTEYPRTTEAKLKAFVVAALEKVGVGTGDAAVVADVLVEADLRGIESHGVARLKSFYIDRIRSNGIKVSPAYRVVRETETTALIDADNGLGHPIAKLAMQTTIEKAKKHGSAFGAVRNSNHYGIAGYYAMLALEHDMIGMASTNSARYAAPTFGRDIMLGTNPLAFAIPAKNEPAFVLDFATTTVAKGRLEVYKRNEKPLLEGWAIDADGEPTTDPDAAEHGALLPLGGYGTDRGGHKGYGLGLLVDILCGVLAGGHFGPTMPLPNDSTEGSVSHWFAAFRIDGFRDVEAFKADMDKQLRAFKDSRTVPGQDRVYVAGEIEHLKAKYARENGVPVHAKVWDGLQRLAGELDVPFDLEQ